MDYRRPCDWILLSNSVCLDHRPGEVIHTGDEEVASEHITHTMFKTTLSLPSGSTLIFLHYYLL